MIAALRHILAFVLFTIVLPVATISCHTENGVVLQTRTVSTDTDSPSPDTTDTNTQDGASRKISLLGFTPSGISDWSTAYPFIDWMKHSRSWYDWDAGTSPDYDLDSNGWVKTLATGQTAGTVFLADVAEAVPVLYDRVIVRYNGEGSIEYDWEAHKIDAESAPGRDVVEIGKGNHLLKITSVNPDNYLRNIAIIPEALEANYENGEIFNPVWLNRMAGVGTLRFSDWWNINESLLENWAERPRLSDRIWIDGQVPIDAIISLSNQPTADPWISLPHRATDDFVRQLAVFVRDNLRESLVVRIEYAHQPWNPDHATMAYADAAGRERWGDHEDAMLQWHAMRTATICEIFKQDVFADAPNRVQCILSVPNDIPNAVENMLQCPYWTAETGAAPCYQHGLDAIAISAFFDGCLGADTHMDTILGWMDDTEGGIARGMEQLIDGRHLPGCNTDIAGMTTLFHHFSALSTSYDLELVAYEGGQRISAVNTPYQEDTDVIDFHVALNRHAEMTDRYRELLTAWQGAGGKTFIHLSDISYPGKYGSWGALEYLTQSTSPKWEALMEFSSQTGH